MAKKDSKNNNLLNAKEAKQDEFYTQMEDISAELRYYRKHFKGAVVLCNCDDPFESNFFKYFALNFNRLKLKKLIATCYRGSPVIATQLSWIPGLEASKELNTSAKKKAYKIIITEVPDVNGDGAIDITDVEWLIKHGDNVLSELKGDGDFRSDECIELMKEATIICTNPPFSLFREYVAQLVKYNKKFLIIGNKNAVTNKDIFPLFMNNKIWFGPSITGGDREFQVPDYYETHSKSLRIDENGNKFIRVPGVHWFTNLDHNKRHEELDLYKKYNPEDYPKYYNYDAIDVSRTVEIPRDYFGEMGVPLTFLDVYNPDQFEIVGNGTEVPKTMIHTVVGDQIQYIKDGEVMWSTPYTVAERKLGNSLRIERDGKPANAPYSRIIIRRKDRDE